MAKKKNSKIELALPPEQLHEVVIKTRPEARITPQMVKWLIEHGVDGNEHLAWHDKRLVECVRELEPEQFSITYLEGDEYLILETANDCVLLTPKDVESLKDKFIKING